MDQQGETGRHEQERGQWMQAAKLMIDSSSVVGALGQAHGHQADQQGPYEPGRAAMPEILQIGPWDQARSDSAAQLACGGAKIEMSQAGSHAGGRRNRRAFTSAHQKSCLVEWFLIQCIAANYISLNYICPNVFCRMILPKNNQ